MSVSAVAITAEVKVDNWQQLKRHRVVAAIVEKTDLHAPKALSIVEHSDRKTGHILLCPAVSSHCQTGYVLAANAKTSECDAR